MQRRVCEQRLRDLGDGEDVDEVEEELGRGRLLAVAVAPAQVRLAAPARRLCGCERGGDLAILRSAGALDARAPASGTPALLGAVDPHRLEVEDLAGDILAGVGATDEGADRAPGEALDHGTEFFLGGVL